MSDFLLSEALYRNIPKCPFFKNRKKILYHSTLMYIRNTDSCLKLSISMRRACFGSIHRKFGPTSKKLQPHYKKGLVLSSIH